MKSGTSKFITPLVLMVLQNGACDATQRSPFTHSCCLGRTWMIRLAHSDVFSLHLSPVGSLISALFRRGSGCVYGTGWATWWFIRLISPHDEEMKTRRTQRIETPNDEYKHKSSVESFTQKSVLVITILPLRREQLDKARKSVKIIILTCWYSVVFDCFTDYDWRQSS